MPACPKDGAALEIDYGMVACPTCGVILFVDLDGNVHVGTGVEPGIEADIAPGIASGPSASSSGAEPSGSASSNGSNEFDFVYDEKTGALAVDQAGDDGFTAPPPLVEPLVEPLGEHMGDEFAPQPELNMDQMLGYEIAPEMQEPAANEVVSSREDPLGISGYANSEFSQAKDGPFLFRIWISGIDSKEIRASLREAITDSRFGWNPDEFMRQIVKGVLKIENVSPVKASIVVNRLKRLPLRIRWEQYAITQTESY